MEQKLKEIREGLALLTSMVDGGEQHSELSRSIARNALEACDDLSKNTLTEPEIEKLVLIYGIDENQKRVVRAVLKEITKIYAPLIETLREISEAKGRYNEDRLIHASNTVEDMQKLATEALKNFTFFDINTLKDRLRNLKSREYFSYPREISPDSINSILRSFGLDIEITSNINGVDMDWGIIGGLDFEEENYEVWGSITIGSFMFQKK